jgi:hypothetical protein
MSSRRGQRSRYQDGDGDDDDAGWGRSSSRRVNGDYAGSSSLSASSMTRELDDLVRIIEADWGVVMTTNVSAPCYLYAPFN